MKRVAQLSVAVSAAVAGVVAAVFLHPRLGAARRRSAAGAARRQSASVATLVGGSVGRGMSRGRRGDPQLAASVRAALTENFGEPSTAVRVTVQGGTVTLRGEVAVLDDIDRYEEVARAAGAADVNNLVRLADAHGTPAASPAP